MDDIQTAPISRFDNPPEETWILDTIGNGLAAIKKNDAATALAEFDKILARNPDHIAALVNKAAVLRSRGDAEGALGCLWRVVQIKEATPDGAAAPDEIIESPGWVRFEISRYKRGKLSSREEHTLSQAEFALLLQHGNLPPDIES